MRAVVHDAYGPPEVARLQEVDRPVPRDDEVLIKIHATTVSRTDCHAERRVSSLTADELAWLVDELALVAGEQFSSLAIVGGAAWKMEGALARFVRQHLPTALEGSVLVLLRGLQGIESDRPGHAVQSLDWYWPTAGELGASPPEAELVNRQQRLADERRAAEAACRAVLADRPKLLSRFESLLEVTQRYAAIREQQARRLTLAWPVLFAHNLFPPPGEAVGPANRGWWEGLDLPASEKLRVRQDLSILDSLEPLIKEVEAELVRQSNIAPWAQQAAFLVQLPGIGVHNAMLLLAAIGDIRRFDAPHKLVGYAGLGARVHSSGEQDYGGRITKQGRRDIRSTMVEAAWVAVGGHAYWKELFERLAVRVGKPKAIIAIARKMLLVVWHVLTKHVADREAISEKIAGKFLEWSWKLGRANRAGLTSGTFIRGELRRLQLGENITAVTRGNRNFPIPLVEEAQQTVG